MHTIGDAVRQDFFSAMTHAPIADALQSAGAVFVGYSGGADSAALLTLMAEFCQSRSLPLAALHVHHGIRGAEADRDEEICRAFCRERGIPLTVRHVNAPDFARSHSLGLEEAARLLRYAAFDEIAGAVKDALVATAHSADDNLETVLFHMLRGAGTAGMCGIPPIRGRYIRPLLHLSGADIRAFCRAEGISYAEDSTNGDTTYTRNYIRAEVVPALRAIAPEPEKSVARMCALLRADHACLEEEARCALGEYAAKTNAPLSLLLSLPDALLSRACVRLYENACGGRTNLTAVHLGDICALVRRGGYGRISLPGKIVARVFDGELSMSVQQCVPDVPPDFMFPLREGEFCFPEYGFGVAFRRSKDAFSADNKNIYKLSICRSLSFAKIHGKAFIRFRRPGDTVRFGGMTRSVKKLLNAAKIPPEKRSVFPLFCDADGILWIPGFPARDGTCCGNEDVYFSYFEL